MDIEQAKSHIEAAWALIVKHSILRPSADGTLFQWDHAKTIDWEKYRNNLYKDFNKLIKRRPPDEIDVCGLINCALYELGDGHSRVTYKQYFHRYGDDRAYESLMKKPWHKQRKAIQRHLGKQQCRMVSGPSIPEVPADFFYIDFDGNDNSEHIMRRLQACSGDKTRCIVLDLRNNRGGFLPAMLNVLAPLFSDSSIEIDHGKKDRKIVFMHEGKAVLNARYRDEDCEPHGFFNAQPITSVDARLLEMPVALLCGEKTCSAGEAILLAFRGRKNTKSFGQPTGDRSTWTINDIDALPNKARIDIVNSIMCDREKVGRGGRIEPDKIIGDGDIINNILEWLDSLTPTPQQPRSNQTTAICRVGSLHPANG